MGDRFYEQQLKANTKVNRRLKADIVTSICTILGKDLPSMSKMTIADLEYVENYLNKKL